MGKVFRILHVFGKLNLGGAESRTMDIYRNIDRDQIQFDFAIHTDEECVLNDEIRDLGGEIYNFPQFNGVNYFLYKKKWESFFKEHKIYKIVHGHQTNTAFIYLNEAKKQNIMIRIAHSRNEKKENTIKNITGKLSRYSGTDFLAVSKEAGINEFGKKEYTRGNIKIFPNAIDAEKYRFNYNLRNNIRRELNIQDLFVVGHIGRFHKQKNHLFLIKIFSKLLKKNENAILLLIGDGPMKRRIIQEIEKYKISERVIILGIRKDIPKLLQGMDIILFPSLYEGLPGVVLEAQAAGLPCVISDSITKEVGITNLVKYLSLKNSPEFWCDVVIEMANNNKSRRNTTQEIIKAGYDIKKISKLYKDFYLKKLISMDIYSSK